MDPAAAHAVQGCGTYGNPRVILCSDGKHRLVGGLCKQHWNCQTCGAIHAKESSQQLSEVVQYLTAQEGLQPHQFLFATLTTNSRIGTTRDRVEAMNAAMTKLVNQRWWKRDVLGYEMAWDFSGSMDSPDGWLNAHIHALWIIRNGLDTEAFKRQVFAFLKRELGDLIGWDRHPDLWRDWLQTARLSPALGSYLHGSPFKGWQWKGSHEVGAIQMKHDKQRGSYRNHYERSIEDLVELQPIIRAQLVRVRRGGVVPKVGVIPTNVQLGAK